VETDRKSQFEKTARTILATNTEYLKIETPDKFKEPI
jgi:hypothetical protein